MYQYRFKSSIDQLMIVDRNQRKKIFLLHFLEFLVILYDVYYESVIYTKNKLANRLTYQ